MQYTDQRRLGVGVGEDRREARHRSVNDRSSQCGIHDHLRFERQQLRRWDEYGWVHFILGTMGAHLAIQSIVSGAAFSDSLLRGMSIGIAVVSQQFPQELGQSIAVCRQIHYLFFLKQ